MQKISLFALIFVLIACSAPAQVIPTVPVALTVAPTSIPTSLPTLTETATPIPTETPTPEVVAITKDEWAKMTPEERMASAPETTENGASNPTFLGENPVAFYYNADGILVEGVNGLSGEHMSETQVFEALLDLNGITKENAFRDDRFTIQTDDTISRGVLGISINSGTNNFELREVSYGGVKYILKGKYYITRDPKDGRVVKIFGVTGVLDANGAGLYDPNYVEFETEFGVAYEFDFWKGITGAMLNRPASITFRTIGHDGAPFDRMLDDEPYPEDYQWPKDLGVGLSGIKVNDGNW